MGKYCPQIAWALLCHPCLTMDLALEVGCVREKVVVREGFLEGEAYEQR